MQQDKTWDWFPKAVEKKPKTGINTNKTEMPVMGFCIVATSGPIGWDFKNLRTRTLPNDQQKQAPRIKRSPILGSRTCPLVVSKYAPEIITNTVKIFSGVSFSLRMIHAKNKVVTVAILTKKPALTASVSAIPIRLRDVPNPAWMPFAKNNFQNNVCWCLKRKISSAYTFGSRVTARIAKATQMESTWKESTSAPTLNPNLAKKICSAQKVENNRTLSNGEAVDVLIALISSEII